MCKESDIDQWFLQSSQKLLMYVFFTNCEPELASSANQNKIISRFQPVKQQFWLNWKTVDVSQTLLGVTNKKKKPDVETFL